MMTISRTLQPQTAEGRDSVLSRQHRIFYRAMESSPSDRVREDIFGSVLRMRLADRKALPGAGNGASAEDRLAAIGNRGTDYPLNPMDRLEIRRVEGWPDTFVAERQAPKGGIEGSYRLVLVGSAEGLDLGKRLWRMVWLSDTVKRLGLVASRKARGCIVNPNYYLGAAKAGTRELGEIIFESGKWVRFYLGQVEAEGGFPRKEKLSGTLYFAFGGDLVEGSFLHIQQRGRELASFLDSEFEGMRGFLGCMLPKEIAARLKFSRLVEEERP